MGWTADAFGPELLTVRSRFCSCKSIVVPVSLIVCCLEIAKSPRMCELSVLRPILSPTLTHMVVISPLVNVSPSPAHSCMPIQADPSSHFTPLNQLRQYFVLP